MKFEIYREERSADWRWRLESKGRIVASGGEGYERLSAMARTLRSLFKESPKRLAELEKELVRAELLKG